MDFFDLHCDTMSECLRTGQNIMQNQLSVDLQRGSSFDCWIQTFAFWIPDDLHKQQAYQCFLKQYEFFLTQKIRRYNGTTKTGCNALLMVEGGSVVAENLDYVSQLRKRNIQLLTLTWNGENEIASGVQAAGGLKPFGRQVIAKLEQEGIIIDVSHLNETSFWDVVSLATLPIVATHSNAYSVCPHPRNLKDEQIITILDRGGLIGLNFYYEFLGSSCENGLDWLHRHVEHFLQLGCQNILAIGSDFDGAVMPRDLKDISLIQCLRDKLINWYGKKQADKILFFNAVKFFNQWGFASLK